MPSLARNIYAHGNKYQTQVTYMGRSIFLGLYDTLEAAEIARDRFKALPAEDKAAYLPKYDPIARPKFKADGIKLPYSYELYQQAKANRLLLSGHKYAVKRVVA